MYYEYERMADGNHAFSIANYFIVVVNAIFTINLNATYLDEVAVSIFSCASMSKLHQYIILTHTEINLL